MNLSSPIIYRLKVLGVVATTIAATIGAGVAWSANGGWVPASRAFVMAQYKSLDDKTEKIYQFQRSDRIERMEESIDSLNTKILETSAKIPDIKDDQTKKLVNDLLDELKRKQKSMNEKLGTLKLEKQLQP